MSGHRSVITFSFLTSWGLLEKTCSAVPAGLPEDRKRYHHNVVELGPPPPAPPSLPRGRGGGAKRGKAKGPAAVEHRPKYDDGDNDVAIDAPLDVDSHLDVTRNAVCASPCGLPSPPTPVLPTTVTCVVHFVDHSAQRGRTESFPMPLESRAAELYETVRWWLGEERIVLFDVLFDGKQGDMQQGRVANVITLDQKLGFASPSACGAEDARVVHPMCLFMADADVSPDTTTSKNEAARRGVYYRTIACQRVASLVEDVSRWAVVYTFVPRGHGDAAGVAWGIPAVVVPVAHRSVNDDDDRQCQTNDDEEKGGVPSLLTMQQIAVNSAAALCCSTYRSRQFFCHCATSTMSVVSSPPASSSSSSSNICMEIIVGYPAFSPGEVVEVLGLPATATGTSTQVSATLGGQRSHHPVMLQISDVQESGVSGLCLFYGKDIHSNTYCGPFLCTQLGVQLDVD